jgi:hypothetical protein
MTVAVALSALSLAIWAYLLFGRMLYPFAWVNDPGRSTSGAAGGCVLLRRSALARIGGMASIRPDAKLAPL